MNITHVKNFDLIKNLPIDNNSTLSNSEIEILNLIFNEDEKKSDDNVKEIIEKKHKNKEIYDTLIAGILFILLSLNIIDNFLLDFIQQKWLLIIKTTIFMLLFWFFVKMKNIKF